MNAFSFLCVQPVSRRNEQPIRVPYMGHSFCKISERYYHSRIIMNADADEASSSWREVTIIFVVSFVCAFSVELELQWPENSHFEKRP